MKKFTFVLFLHVLVIVSDSWATENTRFTQQVAFPTSPPQNFFQSNKYAYVAAHAVGAPVVGALGVAGGLTTSAGWAFACYSPGRPPEHLQYTRPIAVGVGVAGGMAVGLELTDRFGGDKVAIAGGCLVGLGFALIGGDAAKFAIPASMLVAGTLAAWRY